MNPRAQSLKLRKSIFERDKGICSNCQADCEKIKRVYWAIVDFEAQVLYGQLLNIWDEGRTFWEADHIKEIAEGGSNAPENLQTLCIVCHADKTRAWQETRIRRCAPAKTKPVKIPQQPTEQDWRDYYYREGGVDYVLAFTRHYMATAWADNGGQPRTMEPIESDHYGEMIYY